MEPIEIFKKLRDTSDEVIKALEAEDAELTEAAMDKFILLMIKLDCIK